MNSSLFTRAILVLSAATLLAACGGGKSDPAREVAAKVNQEEISAGQIEFVLQRQPGLRPDQVELAGKQVLERLIDQELAVQQAEEQKLDREPRVLQQIEMAKREILARAYGEKIGETAAKPTAEQIAKYYAENPALFAERRIYSLQELSIEARPEQLDALRAKLQAVKNLGEFTEYLKAEDYKFAGNQAVRAAEQLPPAALLTLARLQDGQSIVTRTPTGMQVLLLAGSRSQPVDEARARSSIEAFLSNKAKGELVFSRLQELREKATIEYRGKFVGGPGAAASAPAPEGAASTLDASAEGKGLGLK